MKIVKNLCNEVNLEDKCCKLCYRLIESYFNRGITFWSHPSEVGNYSLDNTV